MKFKEGDTAIINSNDPQNSKFMAGDIVEIIKVYPCDIVFTLETIYKVRDFHGKEGKVYESDLDSYIELPVGLAGDAEYALTGKQCDCGGFKTYATMNELHHSPWCTSRK